MNYAESFQAVIDYIEDHLDAEIDNREMAGLVGYSTYHFQRLFMLLSGVTVAEYIRNRKLAVAAAELLEGENKVLDVAVKYGYNSPTAFNRAFKAMHGIAPSEMKKTGVTIKAFPPVIIKPVVENAAKMDYRIEKLPAFRVVGIKLQTTVEGGQCYKDAPAFWGQLIANGGPGEILALMNQQPMGLLGISDYDPERDSSFDYYIASASDQPVPEGMFEFEVPAAAWAVFPHKNEGPEVIQAYQQRIVMDWLPSSGYEFAKAPDVELYYDNGEMETWIPITRRSEF